MDPRYLYAMMRLLPYPVGLLFFALWGFGLSGPLPACAQLRPFHMQHQFRRPDSFFQNDTTVNRQRQRQVSGIALGGYVGIGTGLGLAWYAGQPLRGFHFFDDSREWLQMDKAGHSYGAYHASRWMIDLYKWSGMPKRQALVRGGAAGFLAMSTIELFDAFGEGWGFSWSDVGANLSGSALAVMNQALWNENRISLKLGYRPSPYTRLDSLNRLFGSNLLENLVKDYNGQSIWMSFRVHAFLPEGAVKRSYPRWLNLAVGYSGEGMIGGYGRDPWPVIRAREYRQLYVGLDIDWAQIRTRSGFLHSLFSILNMVHVPMPAIRFDRRGTAWVMQ